MAAWCLVAEKKDDSCHVFRLRPGRKPWMGLISVQLLALTSSDHEGGPKLEETGSLTYNLEQATSLLQPYLENRERRNAYPQNYGKD